MRKEKNQKKKEIWIWWYLVYGKCIDGSQLWHVHGQYLVYDGTMQLVVELQWNIVAGTCAMMV